MRFIVFLIWKFPARCNRDSNCKGSEQSWTKTKHVLRFGCSAVVQPRTICGCGVLWTCIEVARFVFCLILHSKGRRLTWFLFSVLCSSVRFYFKCWPYTIISSNFLRPVFFSRITPRAFFHSVLMILSQRTEAHSFCMWRKCYRPGFGYCIPKASTTVKSGPNTRSLDSSER